MALKKKKMLSKLIYTNEAFLYEFNVSYAENELLAMGAGRRTLTWVLKTETTLSIL